MTLPRITSLAIVALSFTALSFPVSFSPNVVDTGPVTGITASDINRDGRLDLIVPITFGGNPLIEIMLNNGTGRFEERVVDAASKPLKVVAGDFDKDGYPDVVALESNAIEFFASTRDANLLISKGTKAIGGTGREILAIDLNGNHVPDLALTYCGSGQCELDTFINDGTGKFSIAQERDFAGPHNQQALAAGDFDRDGHDDLALAVLNRVYVLHSENNGNLTTSQALSIAGNIAEFGVASGDIDAKNGADLVFQATDSCGPDCLFRSSAFVFLNDGNGTLVESGHLALGENAGFVNVLADISGDNRLDLLHLRPAVQEDQGHVQYALNVGGGKLGTLVTTSAEVGQAEAAISHDINLDSRHDFSFADSGNLPGTWTYRNTSASVICAPLNTAKLAAKMCSPSASTVSSRTFTVRGSGNSPVGVRRVELWVDGKKIYDSPDDQLKRTVTLSAGTHRVVIQAVDRFGSIAKVVRQVSVP